MIISGIQKTSLIDYPGKICTVLFTRGCNFRCGFCHNPELVINDKFTQTIETKQIFDYIQQRHKLIDAVTITGGEPTLHSDLFNFIKKIKSYRLLVKLDTNGTNPQIIKKLINNKMIDFIAMDIKNTFEKYQGSVNSKINLNNIKTSINLIKNSDINYEFRTTVVPKLHTANDIQTIAKNLKGAKIYAIQNFTNSKTLDPKFNQLAPFNQETINQFKKIAEKYIKKVITR